MSDIDIAKKVQELYHELDEEFCNKNKIKCDGATAIMVLQIGKKIFCSWLGDSRGVYFDRRDVGVKDKATGKRKTNFGHFQEISQDHKPSTESEKKRIEACSGTVIQNAGGVVRAAH